MSRRYHFWPLLNHRSCKGELSKILYNSLESCSIIISNDVQLYAWFEGLQLFLYIYASVFIYFLFLFFAPANRRTNQSLTSNPPFLDHQLLCFGCTTIKSLAFSYCCPPMHIAMMMLKLLVVILFLYFIFLFSIANGVIITYPFLCINSV